MGQVWYIVSPGRVMVDPRWVVVVSGKLIDIYRLGWVCAVGRTLCVIWRV